MAGMPKHEISNNYNIYIVHTIFTYQYLYIALVYDLAGNIKNACTWLPERHTYEGALYEMQLFLMRYNYSTITGHCLLF